MQRNGPMWNRAPKGLVALALLATFCPAGVAVPRRTSNHAPKPLPAQIVAAWKKAGAEVGWVSVESSSWITFLSEKQGVAGAIPAFRFSSWKAGVFAALPAPPAAFSLDLSLTRVTDAGMRELAGLNGLQDLRLALTQVTDAGLKELAGLKSMQALDLGFTKLTDAGLKELARLKGLQNLNISGTQGTDTGLKELVGLESLQRLDLFHTKVTDAGLKVLAGIKSLQVLILSETKVTDAGLKELRKKLPHCEITRR